MLRARNRYMAVEMHRPYIAPFNNGDVVMYYRKRIKGNRPLTEKVRIDTINRSTAYVTALSDNHFFRVMDISRFRALDKLNEIFPGESVLHRPTGVLVEVIAIDENDAWCKAGRSKSVVGIETLQRLYVAPEVNNGGFVRPGAVQVASAGYNAPALKPERPNFFDPSATPVGTPSWRKDNGEIK